MASVVRKSSSSSFQSSKTVTTTHTSDENGSTLEREDSISDLLKEIELEHKKIMESHFKGDSEQMFKHYESLLHSDESSEILLKTDEQDGFNVQLSLKEFKPEDVSVSTSENFVTVKAKQTDKQFVRKFSIPANVDTSMISHNIDSEGMLRITGPKTGRRSSKQISKKSRKSISDDADDPVNKMLISKKERYQNILDKQFHGDIEQMMKYYENSKEFKDDRFLPMYLKSLTHKTSTAEGLVELQDRFEITVDVSLFSESEITVKIFRNWVLVMGKQEPRKGQSLRPRDMRQRYRLPYEVEESSLKTTRSEDGILTIIVPKRDNSIQPTTIIRRPSKPAAVAKKPSTTSSPRRPSSQDSQQDKSHRCNTCAKREANRQKKK